MLPFRFTDESPIELKINSQNRRIRTSDPTSIKPEMRPKFPIKIMAAGEICRYGKTELCRTQSQNRDNFLPIYFCTINDRRVFSCSNLSVLIQDGTVQETLNRIHEDRVKLWTDWSSNSLELNTLECIWA